MTVSPAVADSRSAMVLRLGHCESPGPVAPPTPPGRLVARTATGPLYRADRVYTLVRLDAALTLYQELAARALDPTAQVRSSLAGRVTGRAAYVTWIQQTMAFAMSMTGVPPDLRADVLCQVLSHVRRSGSVDGVEPIVVASANACRSQLDDRMLDCVRATLATATFTGRVGSAVVDPVARTVAIREPAVRHPVSVSRGEWDGLLGRGVQLAGGFFDHVGGTLMAGPTSEHTGVGMGTVVLFGGAGYVAVRHGDRRGDGNAELGLLPGDCGVRPRRDDDYADPYGGGTAITKGVDVRGTALIGDGLRSTLTQTEPGRFRY